MAKKIKPRYPIVRDSCIWEDMAGDSVQEKMINSILTSNFIACRNIPADECLSEAKEIIAKKRTKGRLIQYLKSMFSCYSFDCPDGYEEVADEILEFLRRIK